MYPKDLKYTESHEWVKIEGNVATIGITSYAVKKLLEIIYIELPEVGDKIRSFKSFGTVESSKATAEVSSPLDGIILEKNKALEEPDKVDIINQDPYGEGWLVKIKIDDKSKLDKLLSAKEYEEFLKTEEH